MDCITLVISLIGVVFAISYTLLVPRKAEDDETIKSTTKTEIPENLDKELLLKDYDITNQEIERRENITLVVGSILIAAAFLIASQPFLINNKTLIPIAALASIVLYLLWLFVLHLTTKYIDEIAYIRIHVLEERISELEKSKGYKFGVHTFLQEQIKEKVWIKVRRSFWGLLFIMLCGYWILISIFY